MVRDALTTRDAFSRLACLTGVPVRLCSRAAVALAASCFLVSCHSGPARHAAGVDAAHSPRGEVSATGEASRPAASTAAAEDVRNRGQSSEVIAFSGYGPAIFGEGDEAVRIAWGRPLRRTEPAPGSSCYYLLQDPPAPALRGISFMIEHGRFVRYDVDGPSYVAPGGIVVGDTEERVVAAHAGRFERQPHKYVAGAAYLIVVPPDGGGARWIFETTPDGRVERWRIGIPPQVYYVEGCG